MKRLLSTNIAPSGSLDTDAVTKALLLHRNTSPPDIGPHMQSFYLADP